MSFINGLSGAMRKIVHAALCAAIMLPCASIAPALAQQDFEESAGEGTEETIEPIRLYTVELIVFTYGDGGSTGTEIWLPERRPIEEGRDTGPFTYLDPGSSRLLDVHEEPAEVEMPAVERRYIDLELTMFRPDDFTMNRIHDRLVNLDAYEPIVWSGWIQPTFEKSVTPPIRLSTLADLPPGLDGSLTLYRGRFLHLVVDLMMDADRRSAPPDDTSTIVLDFGDSRLQNDYQLVDEHGNLLGPPVRYRILEDRIMRNGDIRYFDHPKFGVIAKVTRIEETGDEDIDDTGDLLPGDLVGQQPVQ
jgi:hypothetical protein